MVSSRLWKLHLKINCCFDSTLDNYKRRNKHKLLRCDVNKNDADDMAEPVNIDIEKFMNEFGHFGTAGAITILSLSVPLLCYALVSYLGSHLTQVDRHRCFVPECENRSTAVYITPWLRNALNVYQTCKRYKPLTSSRGNYTFCPATWFDSSIEISCDKDDLVYLRNVPFVMKDLGLVCEKTQILLTVEEYLNYGKVVCSLLVGVLADKYGRKPVIITVSMVSSVFGFLQIISWNYVVFFVFYVLVSLSCQSILNTTMTLGIEMVGKKARTLAICVLGGYYSFYYFVFALLSDDTWKWKKHCFIYLIFLPSVTLYWVIPESVRWLRANGKEKKLIKELRRIARRKGVNITEGYLEKFRSSRIADDVISETDTAGETAADDYEDDVDKIHGKFDDKTTESKKQKKGEKQILKDFNYSAKKENRNKTQDRRKQRSKWKKLLKSKECMLRIFILSFINWTAISFTAITTMPKLTLLIKPYGTLYTHIMLSSVLQLVGYICLPELNSKFGRKKIISITQIMYGLGIIIFLFYEDITARTVLYYCLKIIISLTVGCLYMYTGELLPTELRVTLLTLCYSFSNIGPYLQDLWVLLEEKKQNLSIYIFSGYSIISAILIFILPETMEQELPETVEETEMLKNERNEEVDQFSVQRFM